MGETREVRIDYAPRNIEFHDNPARWKVLVCHRRWGKTTFALNHLIRDAMRIRNGRFAYIAPYYKQAKAVAWDMLKKYSLDIPGVKFNESELRVDYPGGSRIQLFGADNTDALRGLALWGVVFDEYSQQPSSIFTEVIRPALSDHKGYAIWIGTPKGRNDFYRLYEEKQADPDWLCILIRASESEIIDQEELESAKKGMSMDEYNQEFECSFESALKGAYYSAQLQDARRENRITKVDYNPSLPVCTYWDLGISDYTSITFAQQVGREIHIIDYYENNNLSLGEYALFIRSKPYNYDTHYLPWDAAPREMATNRSRKDIIIDHLGNNVQITPNLTVKDGIEAARKIFPKCWFDKEKTAALVDALGSYTQEWDDKKGMYRDKPLHNWASHAADSFRYLAIGYKEQIDHHAPKAIKSAFLKERNISNNNNFWNT